MTSPPHRHEPVVPRHVRWPVRSGSGMPTTGVVGSRRSSQAAKQGTSTWRPRPRGLRLEVADQGGVVCSNIGTRMVALEMLPPESKTVPAADAGEQKSLPLRKVVHSSCPPRGTAATQTRCAATRCALSLSYWAVVPATQTVVIPRRLG